MAKRYYEYKIIDKITGDVILKDAGPQEVSNKIGIKTTDITNYVAKGILYKRRYIIERTKIDDTKERNYSPAERLWMDEWDKARLILNPKARKDSEKTQEI